MPSDTQAPARPHRYSAALACEIEPRWQLAWAEAGTFNQPNPGEPGFDASKPKFYCLDMFPYPSGAGLHVGHPEGYTATDILCRYKRMSGFNVLHPMGWDAFGLPAEQYAIQTGVHPAKTTSQAIDNFRRQLQRFGFCYDWSREFGTIDPDYYKWTQWIFLQIYGAWYDTEQKKARPIGDLVEEFASGKRPVRLNSNAAEYAGAGDLPGGTKIGDWSTLDAETQRAIIDSYRLAYVAEQTVNWCPKLGTALANEEVIDGKSERGGFPVLRKPLKQWMFRITAYGDRLLEGLDTVDWPSSTRIQQTEWIGRSEGAEVEFPLLDPTNQRTGESLRIFTTRPDTIFGATYMVVAPEHHLVDEAIAAGAAPDTEALKRYVTEARNRSDVERQEAKTKTGVFTGVSALNPATGKPIPVWTADYVLMGYGTGAIMAVPGQDERDWEFAEVFNLPIVRTVEPSKDFDGKAFTGDGPAINSANSEISLDGLKVTEAKAKIIDWLESKSLGQRKINFKLRDWLFSRQRYWGEPFPIVWDERGNHHPVDESKLPVTLPDLADYQPVESEDPKPLLGKASDWMRTTAGDAGVSDLDPSAPVTRELNTMPGWAGSCWYYLRYCDPKNEHRFVGEEAERYWMSSPGRSALRADRAAPNEPERSAKHTGPPSLAPESLDALPDTPYWIPGFVERDPYPEGESGPARDLIARVRHLPHFELPGATYFVTWRATRMLSDADRDEILASLLHFEGQRCTTIAACVMPDHVHWIVRPLEDQPLTALVSSVKRFSSTAVNKRMNASGSIWQADRFDHIVRDGGWLSEFVRYIAHNPVEEQLVERPSQYRWTFIHGDLRLDGQREQERASNGSARRADLPKDGGVDLYIGGAEHAVLHLLYARFWHKVLYDLGHVSTDEPFKKLFHQGLILSHAYQRTDRSLVPIDEVENRGEEDDPTYIETASGNEVTQIVAKMSKSLKNVVNPDDVIADFGADVFRLYEMYMGPLEASKPWNTRDIVGLQRFLQRAWRMLVNEDTGELTLIDAPDESVEKQLHRTIAKVGQDIERLAFNTAIAAMIEFTNSASNKGLTADQASRFVRILAPFAPHAAEEIWDKLKSASSADASSTVDGFVSDAPWPNYDEAMLRDDEVEIPIQIRGKVRAKIMVPADADKNAIESIAMNDAKVKELIEGQTVRKVVVVPGRMVNIVI